MMSNNAMPPSPRQVSVTKPRLGLEKAVSRFRRHYCHHHHYRHCYLGRLVEGVWVLGGMASTGIRDMPK